VYHLTECYGRCSSLVQLYSVFAASATRIIALLRKQVLVYAYVRAASVLSAAASRLHVFGVCSLLQQGVSLAEALLSSLKPRKDNICLTSERQTYFHLRSLYETR